MALIPITPKAGIVKNGTDYSNKGRWVDGNLVRFRNGYLGPIGGWQKLRNTALDGTPIGMYSYNTNSGNAVLAVGTRQKVYVFYNSSWYDITPSGFINDESLDPLGFGAWQFGKEDFGDARSQSGLNFGSQSFSFDNWGEELVFCFAGDGKIYRWQPSSPSTIAAPITNAPLNNLAVIVSNERHLFAIGSANDSRKIAWSDREDNTNWTSKATNTAGDLIIPSGGEALYATKFRSDIMVFTDIGLNRVYYTGSPFVYGIAEAGTNCKTISVRSIVQAGNFLAWLGENSIFIYDGTVKEIPCEVHDYIFDDLTYEHRRACWGGHNQNFNEIWWGFPTGTNQETANKYVIWNYKDNTWSIGELDRTSWEDQGVLDYPVATDSSGFVYEHEIGVLFNSPDLGTTKPFCKSGPLEIAQGEKLVQVNQIIPDEEAGSLPGVTISFTGKFTPLGSETDFGSFTFDNDGYTDARFTARQVQMKIEGSTTQDFKVGNIRLNAKTRGKR